MSAQLCSCSFGSSGCLPVQYLSSDNRNKDQDHDQGHERTTEVLESSRNFPGLPPAFELLLEQGVAVPVGRGLEAVLGL